ncbi:MULTISPECIES: UDP-N-acetylmuramate--L-alanine ligase [Candidatus Ichthyocystis]|uniref:UDP-N-acetylmuramate--L-alanine ligase n=2 Tax=Candidatus Ichthyocystis TaxID=2929841 RepID=A0A0S4M2M4_9BURK|nr:MULTISPECIES: UDP-N-acetylmuramate--L-alanine ligase [Ichthyocystis]CUT17472.1 UDP-N-acetylmuramate--L-alanine ligase [Candidatus Ichthyocystis hellenicum]
MKRKINHVHFVGIGGSGMSGIAEVLMELGYTVSGSDITPTEVTDRLFRLGAVIFIGHDASNIGNSQIIVQSSAISIDNVEIVEGLRRSIPVIPRAKMLSDLMRLKRGIAVAGTHGKTTTTSLIVEILCCSGRDPTFVIGGCLGDHNHGASLGKGEDIVVEADESDRTFLLFRPVINVVTNIDSDHMQTYDHDFNRLLQAFLEFIDSIPFYGFSFLCNDDPNIKFLLPSVTRPFFKYGFSSTSDIRAKNCSINLSGSSFIVEQDGFPSLSVDTPLIGEHNVLNCLAAIGVCRQLEVDDKFIRKALLNFSGISRRLQRYDNVCLYGCLCSLVDDYGHHPVEIAVTTKAIRQVLKNRRIILVFQPHRVTRTIDLFQEFVTVLSSVDELIMLPVYTAGEEIIQEECLSKKLIEAMFANGATVSPYFVESLDDAYSVIGDIVCNGDVILIMGAGSISKLKSIIFSRAGYERK